MTEASKPSPSTGATAGGHLTKKQRKEQFEALGALQTQLDVSVSFARNKVASWLSVDGFSDDEEDTKSSSKSGSSFVAQSEIKARQPGLGLGAKYISHKDAMRHVPMNAFESKLKRQMTGGVVAAELQRADQAEKNALPDKYQEHKLMMAARRKEQQEQQEDEEDSKTRNVGGSGASNISASGAPSHQKKSMSTPVHPAAQPSKGGKYQPVVHPAALKASTHPAAAAVSSTPKSTGGPSKKRMGDFFSTYMDERAQKMAKKKKKSQGKADPDDD
ncbi:hypothetical protein BGZ52_001311 [Haplosporangium bisporale]|nr:hypothetical protein BGZ52_001311 [Haplosporangium bisporale]